MFRQRSCHCPDLGCCCLADGRHVPVMLNIYKSACVLDSLDVVTQFSSSMSPGPFLTGICVNEAEWCIHEFYVVVVVSPLISLTPIIDITCLYLFCEFTHSRH